MPAIDHPITFLQGDYEHGWLASRNSLKPLNHLEYLKEKRRMATLPGLPPEYALACHVEFHPSDACNLACKNCVYDNDIHSSRQFFSLAEIDKVFRFKPQSMVITGGGEPTLHPRFSELVGMLPDIQLALITNGTVEPSGNWPDRFSWIRISIDAATKDTYEWFRGRDYFDKVLRSFLQYLEYDIKYVGVGFVFSRYNMHEYADFARLIYDLVPARDRTRVNVQYRPLRRDPQHRSRPFFEALSEQDIKDTADQVFKLACERPDMIPFLREQTNITDVLGGNVHTPRPFSNCHYAELFKIVRANGDIRPCCICPDDPALSLGNILTDSLDSIAQRMCNIVKLKAADYCNPVDCRMGSSISHTLEAGLKGKLEPSKSLDVQADLMF